MTLQAALIYGSVRDQRQGIRAARFLHKKLEENGFEVNFVDAIDYDLPFLNKMYKEYDTGKAPANLEELATIFRNSDALIIVSGEYNHGVPPALKNLLDHFQAEYLFKPAGIACYSAGIFGGVRAAIHLRAVLGELGMASISSMFPVPQVQKAFDENGNPNDEAYHQRIQKFLDELKWYAEALKKAREQGTPF